jgi:epoxide hydrolase-like predicted phosphatase
MTRIQAVIFDFGGVLYRTPNPRWLRGLQRILRIPDTGLIMMTHASPTESSLVMDIMTGRTQEQAVWDEFAHRWRISPAVLARLRLNASAPNRLNRELLLFLANQRPAYKTAILTNAGTDFRQTFCDAYNLNRHVDQVIISAEEGLAKPDPRIYHLAAERLGITAAEAVFVDDFIENVEGARAAGMQAVQYLDNLQTIQAVQELLSRGD